MASPDRPQQPDASRTAAAAAAAAGEGHEVAAPGTGSRALLPPTERFATRTAGMTASEIRALFAVASRPEVVSLAGGMPNLAALPLQSLASEVADLGGERLQRQRGGVGHLSLIHI